MNKLTSRNEMTGSDFHLAVDFIRIRTMLRVDSGAVKRTVPQKSGLLHKNSLACLRVDKTCIRQPVVTNRR